jgi:hypothetical protein
MSELLKPPAVPLAMLNFFAQQPDFSALAGDVSEEFHQRVQSSGAQAATLWYWREASRNAWVLTVRELLRTPVRTTVMAASCFWAVNIVTNLYIVEAEKLGVFLHSGQFMFLFLLRLMTFLTMGWVGGRLLSGREWALALTFTAVSVCVAGTLRSYYPALHFSVLGWVAVISVTLVQQSAFWLGSLWIRQSKNTTQLTSRVL